MKIKLARRAVQTATLAAIVAVPLMAKGGVTAILGSMYSFSVGPVWITDPLGGLQAAIGAMGLDMKLLVSIMIPIALALALGRVFCGWMCPQNTLSELFDFLGQRLRVRRIVVRATATAMPRYVVLALVVAAGLALGLPTANLISAPGIISLQAGKYLIEGRAGLELALILGIILVELIIIRRAWCNYLCPIGGFLGLLRAPQTLKVVMREDESSPCGGCRECSSVCRLGLDPMGGKIYPLCHNCGDCVEACRGMSEKHAPLRFKF